MKTPARQGHLLRRGIVQCETLGGSSFDLDQQTSMLEGVHKKHGPCIRFGKS